MICKSIALLLILFSLVVLAASSAITTNNNIIHRDDDDDGDDENNDNKESKQQLMDHDHHELGVHHDETSPEQDAIIKKDQQQQQQQQQSRSSPSSRVKMGLARLFFTLDELWRSWMNINAKQYLSASEESSRFDQFVQAFDYVKQHNERYQKGLESYDIELNRFADMTKDEFRRRMTGFKPQLMKRRRQQLRTSNNDNHHHQFVTLFQRQPEHKLPKQVDWRQQNAVTQVKDQKNCGCCWAFSATGSLEGQYYLKTKHLISLSEQNLVDCSRKYGNEGCDGGIMDDAFQYIRDNGIETEAAYPYEGRENKKCRYNKLSAIDLKLSGYVDIPEGDEAALAEAVAFHGPVSVAMDASHKSLQYYTEGVYAEPKCGNTTETLDHAVLLVGYGTDRKSKQDYWLVKNSWGARWGEQGYVRIARNMANMCGIASMASYPVLAD